MHDQADHFSPSGVLIAKDFRENLIIDRYDPVFTDMRASKIKHLRSVNSEDAVTWNVFRSLRQIAPSVWLPALWRRTTPPGNCYSSDSAAVVNLWQSIPPPIGLLAGGDEGASEIDVVIETPTWVWFIEAKYRSDISFGTTTRPERDQILRNIDVGSYYAGVRQFFFSLLIASESRSPEGVKKIGEYSNLSIPRTKLLPHRPDGLSNLRAITILTWAALADVLDDTSKGAPREDERTYASRAFLWMQQRGLVANHGK